MNNSDKIKSLPPVSEMMRHAGLEPKKQFGQNFLFDLNLTGRIARSVPNITTTDVIEVGPGPGGLTRALLVAGARRVIAVEKDKTTKPILDEIVAASDGRLTVIYGDAMRINFSEFGLSEYAICSNLPYNVGTELLVNWLTAVAHGAPLLVGDALHVVDLAGEVVLHRQHAEPLGEVRVVGPAVDALRAQFLRKRLRVNPRVLQQLRVGRAKLGGDDQPGIRVIKGKVRAVHVDALRARGRGQQAQHGQKGK